MTGALDLANRIRRLLSPTGWAVVLAVVCIIALLATCARDARRDAQRAHQAAEIAAGLTEARTQAARDAGLIRDGAEARDAAIDNLNRRNTDAIQSAPGADQRLDPAVTDAGRRALCLRDATRGDPACRELFQPRPR
ncbi:hypothetical protein [uncultured Brevundimonas sp.]|uniref:hypothetical protein n=1 Tax=uncultured Brevundimonas sp. TaxID=213418 RepID=UPI0026286FF5|nr:hypothetical protein [uncultured Brevundimonas sp.]